MAITLDVNDVVNGLLEQLGALAKENALLKVQLSLATRAEEEEPEDADN